MGNKIGVKAERKTCRIGRTKSKSGCRTCKIRRIKCDEIRPACNNCVSTGRACDGYGIWGGGATAHVRDSSVPQETNVALLQCITTSSPAESPEEAGYFDWFRCRTTNKLPGLFASSFWDTLLLQASSSEPAVWHAIIALSSIHKRNALNGKYMGTTIDIQEQFMLRQYSKAIGQLVRPGQPPKSKGSIRVTLVTCIVFIYLELLPERYGAAQTHLDNGLKLLKENQINGNVEPHQYGESTDDSIVEAFFRMYVQDQLLVQPSQLPFLSFVATEINIPTPTFKSPLQARRYLHLLLNEIFHFTKQAKQQALSNPAATTLELVNHQRRLRSKLASWHESHIASKASFCHRSILGGFIFETLCIYHIMATIMTHTCLSPSSEWLYSSHTNSFVTIIMKAIYLRKHAPKLAEMMHGQTTEKSKTVVDMGWIPPLYYTAVKCRIHRVRLQAIKLLESTGENHQEGIWDSTIAACVARKVMEVEERNFYGNLGIDDDFAFDSAPRERDFLLPALPEEYHIRDVQVALPGDRMGKVVLSFCQEEKECSWEYDLVSNCWVDRRDNTDR